MSTLLVDGTNVVMRFASVMTPKDEEPTPQQVAGVLHAVARALAECAVVVEASHLIVALDSSVGSWRRERFPEYKAGRTISTSVWSNRLAIHLSMRNVLCLREPGFEADDILATIANRIDSTGRAAFILSGDSDLLQCTSLLTRCVQFGAKGEPRFVVRSMEWIKEKYHLPRAYHLAAYKALVGEPGDGLPGVPGIGPVKARRLLELAPAIEDIPKMLKESEAEAYALALELVTLRTDVPLAPIHPASCRLNAQRLVIA
jgi:DNA polymerase-1